MPYAYIAGNDQGPRQVQTLDALQKTHDVLKERIPLGWTGEADAWWTEYISTERMRVHPENTDAYPYEMLKAWNSVVHSDAEAVRGPADDPHISAFIFPEHRPMRETRVAAETAARRQADPAEIKKGDMIIVQAADDQVEIRNESRSRDIATPFWMGKVVDIACPRKIEVQWFLAEHANMKKPHDDPWMNWKWEGRFNPTMRSRPLTDVLDRYECGLLCFGFNLKESGPRYGMKASTVKLVRERLSELGLTVLQDNA